jgi:hypothetical protein
MRIAALVAAGLLAGLALPAQAQDRAPTPIPIEEWSADKVGEMGKAIYRQDVAAWVATDALVAHLAPAPLQAPLVGWIVVDQGQDQVVRFIRLDGETLRPAYDIPVHDGVAGAVVPVSEGELSPAETAAFRARQTAIENIGRLRCSRNLNTVVLDDPDSDGWLVWLLTATTDANIVPLGGHYRFRISADGSTVVRRDMLSNSCINLPKQQGQNGQPEALMITQIVSNGPVETHVFLSLQNRLPIYVAAGGSIYAVTGADIRKVED